MVGIVDKILNIFNGYNFLIIPAALFSVILHEISHGYVAYLLGDNTAKARGRLSLNPLKHIDILGLICMIIFKFGWAKPVPVNPYYFKHRKLGMVLVSIAGPLSNIILCLISMAIWLSMNLVWPENRVLFVIVDIFREFFEIFMVLNVSLAVFNLIPIPPLDGSKILFSVLPNRAYGFVLKYERYGMLLLIILLNIPFFLDILTGIQSFILNMMLKIFAPILEFFATMILLLLG